MKQRWRRIRGGEWHPLGAEWSYHARPATGDLFAHTHGVWRALTVEDLERALWSDDDEEGHAAWLTWAKDGAEWPARPYRVEVEHVAGHNPMPKDGRGEQHTRGALTIHANSRPRWHIYESGRWPMCSCCGEPMPCRAQMIDWQVEEAAATIDDHAHKMPSCCWGCGEPITARQRSVVYAGTNLDLPGGPEVRFHTRKACRYQAETYERRWLTDDPDRPRILTYPKCGGRLVVHGDATSECFGGEDDCQGHPTHDHGHITACFAQTHGCPRECPREDHRGAWLPPRPPRQRIAGLG